MAPPASASARPLAPGWSRPVSAATSPRRTAPWPRGRGAARRPPHRGCPPGLRPERHSSPHRPGRHAGAPAIRWPRTAGRSWPPPAAACVPA
ncbi:hypothetical protein G6F61_014281 [Rhizopus arrhizus]|nr:hypothetical protein G6F31_020540 [Rhizopus arrhizus]KAG1361596.1 hypothetical protein G6F61_014281 [Rhizopus arrhizus]